MRIHTHKQPMSLDPIIIHRQDTPPNGPSHNPKYHPRPPKTNTDNRYVRVLRRTSSVVSDVPCSRMVNLNSNCRASSRVTASTGSRFTTVGDNTPRCDPLADPAAGWLLLDDEEGRSRGALLARGRPAAEAAEAVRD